MIGGNKIASLQKRTGTVKNEIGEAVPQWETVQEIRGWLDMSSGEARYTTFSAKIQESTHIFVGDYVPVAAKAEESRIIIDGRVYDVLLIDNPMELNKQIEIYLKFKGGQNG